MYKLSVVLVDTEALFVVGACTEGEGIVGLFCFELFGSSRSFMELMETGISTQTLQWWLSSNRAVPCVDEFAFLYSV
ncbi:MAG: hypothetical protein JW715_17110 [Sedimentisphaerales bacterium]|nr:hypothetical protein [Sedimentisphaerales bacterium]